MKVDLKPGTKLKNGATVIQGKDNIFHEGYTVLCVKDNGEFVTWITDEAGNTYHGHYYSDIQEALNDFNNRS